MSLRRPIDEARDFFGHDFEGMIDIFFRDGYYMYSGDDFFVMAYPYRSSDLIEEENVDLFRLSPNKSVDKTDTWVIHYFAGDIKRLFAIAPFLLDYVAFQRKGGRWKLYNTDDLQRRLTYGIT